MATATEKKTEVKFKIKSPINFITFLKRFTLIDKGLLLEVYEDCIKAKAHAERAVIKYSKMGISHLFEGDMPVELIKIGIYDIKKVISVFNHFGDGDEIFLHIKYEKVSGEYIATELIFKSASLKIKVLTADTATFDYISAEMLKRLMDSVLGDKIIEFPFPKDAFAKAKNLCSMDSGKDFLALRVADNSAHIAGKSFDYTVCDVAGSVNTEFTFFNEHFEMIEPEISTITIGMNRMLVKSQESDTIVIIGRIAPE